MDIAAAERFGVDFLPRGGLHQRGPAEEDRALVLHDDRLVAHRGHVGAARRAGTHDNGDLGDSRCGQVGLVVEDPPEVVLVRENPRLHGQERAPGVDQVDAGQGVLVGDLLGAEMLLDCYRVVGASLHGGIVGDDHAFLARDASDAGHEPRRRNDVVVEFVTGELADLEERRARVEQPAHPVPG